MATYLFASVLLLAAEPEHRPPNMNGVWVLGDAWDGYMGIELKLKGDEFEYWFWSDVKGGEEPKYPIRGKVLYRGTSIQLKPADEKANLYSSTWRLVVNDGEICMLADKDLQDHRPPKLPSSRLLFKFADDDEKLKELKRTKLE